MRYRASFFVGAALGYVLGTRAGRERYEQMRQAARMIVLSRPVRQAAEGVRSQAGDLAGRAKDKSKEMAGAAKGRVADRLPHRSVVGEPGAPEAQDVLRDVTTAQH